MTQNEVNELVPGDQIILITRPHGRLEYGTVSEVTETAIHVNWQGEYGTDVLAKFSPIWHSPISWRSTKRGTR